MSSAQGQRITANCKLIWGEGDYDLSIETDDHLYWACHVRKEFGTGPGPPLTMTGLCNRPERAWEELDRMLSVWATQIQSEQSMTKEKKLEIFGGPNGRNRRILERFSERFSREPETRGDEV